MKPACLAPANLPLLLLSSRLKQQSYAIYLTDDQGALSTLDLFETQDYSSFDSTRKEPGPAPAADVGARHPPLRRPRLRPSREQIIHELVEATAEVSRLGALLAATPEPEAREESGRKPKSAKGRHGAPSMRTGTETEASSYIDEPYQPEDASLPPKSLKMSVVSENSYDLRVSFLFWRPATH